MTEISLSERIESLEIRISYQDRTIEELNKIVVQLRDQVDQLTQRSKELSEQAKISYVTKDTGTLPPHY